MLADALEDIHVGTMSLPSSVNFMPDSALDPGTPNGNAPILPFTCTPAGATPGQGKALRIRAGGIAQAPGGIRKVRSAPKPRMFK